jgi:hypothetical protein
MPAQCLSICAANAMNVGLMRVRATPEAVMDVAFSRQFAVSSVAFVRWPQEMDRRNQLVAGGVPCLLVVASGASPPEVHPWEDWIRLPTDERDLSCRLRGLAQRVSRAELVDDVLFRNVYGAIALSATEAAVIRVLLESRGAPIHRDALTSRVWPSGPPSPRSLGDVLYRLRRRLEPLHLDIHSHGARGYLMGLALNLLAAPDQIADDDEASISTAE